MRFSLISDRLHYLVSHPQVFLSSDYHTLSQLQQTKFISSFCIPRPYFLLLYPLLFPLALHSIPTSHFPLCTMFPVFIISHQSHFSIPFISLFSLPCHAFLYLPILSFIIIPFIQFFLPSPLSLFIFYLTSIFSLTLHIILSN